MRTITDIDDIYWAFAEMHSANSIIIGGERTETTLEDGHVVYLTEEERRFLDAVNRLRPANPLTRDTLIKNTVTADKLAEPLSTATLFTAVCGLERHGLTGKCHNDAPEYARKAVDMVDAEVRKAVAVAMQSLKKYTGDLNGHQMKITACHAIDTVWDALGDRFKTAVGRAAHRLMTVTSFTESTDAHSRFLLHFIRTHARSAVIGLSRAAYYSELFTFCNSEESVEYPEHGEILNTDIKYGSRLGNQDVIAMQLNLLNMYRMQPGMARGFLGERDGTRIDALLAELSKLTPASFMDTELRDIIKGHFAELGDAIAKGVKLAIGFLKDSPILMVGLDGLSRDYILSSLETKATLNVYASMACLGESDLADILKDIASMKEKDATCRPFRDYPGAIVMKHVRIALHDRLFRMRLLARVSGRI